MDEFETAARLAVEKGLREGKRREGIVDRDGISWHEAPLPPRLHRCRQWTTGLGIGRCACGATFLLGGWVEKNSRRTSLRRRAGRRWWQLGRSA